MDNAQRNQNTKDAIEFCKKYPQYKLSIQSHKYLDIP